MCVCVSVETLQTLVNGSLGGAVGQQVPQEAVGGVGPVSLPRRAETFGGFDSHQMNISKSEGLQFVFLHLPLSPYLHYSVSLAPCLST